MVNIELRLNYARDVIPLIPMVLSLSKHYPLKIISGLRYRALAAGPQDVNIPTLTKMNIFHAGLPMHRA